MQFQLGPVLAAMCAVLVCSSAAAQVPAHQASPSKRYCHQDAGFCFKYPSTWSVQGEVFAGNGVVIAAEQGQDRAIWDDITAGLIIPRPKDDADPVTIDQVVEQTMASLREGGENVETVQRQVRIVDGKPAQMLTLRYTDKTSRHDWVEKLALIEGSEGEIYSVALKCSPQSLVRLEPVLSGVLQSWKLHEPRPAADAAAGNEDKPPH